MQALTSFCISPKEFQLKADTDTLDLLQEHNKIGDVNQQIFNFHASSLHNYLAYKTVWHVRNLGFFKKISMTRGIYCVGGGTPMHAAVYR